MKCYPQREEEEEQFQQEFDKIFHNEKVDVAHLNPSHSGDIDEERKNYYRYVMKVEGYVNINMSLVF